MLDPHKMLDNVHPDLVKVLQATPQEPQPFQVTYGIRTLEAEAEAVRTGHSQTMHSRHLPGGGFLHPNAYFGKCLAVDVTPLDDGKINFEQGYEAHSYGAVALAIVTTAKKLKIPVEWGATWQVDDLNVEPGHFHDWGHFQLPRESYP